MAKTLNTHLKNKLHMNIQPAVYGCFRIKQAV